MRKLNTQQRATILSLLVEGVGINAASRLTGASKVTILRLLVDVGSLAAEYLDLVLRDLHCERIEFDEMWSFVGATERAKQLGAQGYGDCWVWLCLDPATKLIVSFLPGLRDDGHAHAMAHDVRSRIANTPEISTDGLRLYSTAISESFGSAVDFAQLTKYYAQDGKTLIGTRTAIRSGSPKRVCTSYIERFNLSLRMRNRRMARRTNAHSKRIENHQAMLALSILSYNFVKKHESLKTTPAVAAGVADHAWTMVEVIELLEREEKKLGGGRITEYLPAVAS